MRSLRPRRTLGTVLETPLIERKSEQICGVHINQRWRQVKNIGLEQPGHLPLAKYLASSTGGRDAGSGTFIRTAACSAVFWLFLPFLQTRESRATGCLFSAWRVAVGGPPLENEAGAWPLPGHADPPSGGGGADEVERARDLSFWECSLKSPTLAGEVFGQL
jgi:hypothetical protein